MPLSGPALPSAPAPLSLPRETPRAGPALKVLYFLTVAAMLLLFVVYAVAYTSARGSGSPESGFPYTEALGTGRDAVFVTRETAASLNTLEWIVICGIPGTMLLGIAVWMYYAFYAFLTTRAAAIFQGVCPRCMKGPIHTVRITMHDACPVCGANFQREQGYLVGALYFSYLFCILLAIPPFAVMLYLQVYEWKWWLLATVVPSILLGRPMIRLSRSMWMHVDFMLNPWTD